MQFYGAGGMEIITKRLARWYSARTAVRASLAARIAGKAHLEATPKCSTPSSAAGP